MKRYTKQGFTLIELLVVIAIIGILAAIVLTSLGSARDAAKDASAKGSLSSMRAEAEIYYTENDNYGASDALCSDSDFADLASAVENNATSYTCHSDDDSWVASALLSDGTTYFCVDSTGYAGETDGAPGDANTTCAS